MNVFEIPRVVVTLVDIKGETMVSEENHLVSGPGNPPLQAGHQLVLSSSPPPICFLCALINIVPPPLNKGPWGPWGPNKLPRVWEGETTHDFAGGQ